MPDTMQHDQIRLTQRGAALFAMALVIAVISSLVAYAVLIVSMSQARQGKVLRERPRVRYAAEAGLVVLKERLWRDPNYCPGGVPGGVGGLQQGVDTDGDGGDDTFVDLTWTNCGAGNRHLITARVTY